MGAFAGVGGEFVEPGLPILLSRSTLSQISINESKVLFETLLLVKRAADVGRRIRGGPLAFLTALLFLIDMIDGSGDLVVNQILSKVGIFSQFYGIFVANEILYDNISLFSLAYGLRASYHTRFFF